jgi:eukaryotic-like serine/threonine-protein kinase
MGYRSIGTFAANGNAGRAGARVPRIDFDAAGEPGRPGLIIARRYRLEALVGSELVCSVWRAEELRSGAHVALKFLDPDIAEDPDLLDGFFWEARSAAAVSNAHVAHILDYGVDSGTPYLATEWLDGETLERRLGRQQTINTAELDRVFREAAQALDEAHELGVIQPEVKPSQLFLAQNRGRETTKLIFGVARMMNDTLDLVRKLASRAGAPSETSIYMSPEQVLGKNMIGQRSELWSLAVIAFECLTGKHPFAGHTLGERLVQICTGSPTPPSRYAAVPAGFDEWFARGVNKAPRERFTSALHMADSLTAALAR